MDAQPDFVAAWVRQAREKDPDSKVLVAIEEATSASALAEEKLLKRLRKLSQVAGTENSDAQA